jgi:uncharacterized protein (DUF952 family)
MQVFHVTTPEAWAEAQRAGAYTTSTRGRTLAEEGFIHCSTEQQVDGVRGRYFADLPRLLLLEIDTDRLTSPWRVEEVPGTGESYPHVYGPVDLGAVTDVRPL